MVVDGPAKEPAHCRGLHDQRQSHRRSLESNTARSLWQKLPCAAHLADRVLPAVPVRQWVMSFPRRVRWRLARDDKLLSKVITVFNTELAVIRTDEGIGVPLDGRPSTHILKLPNPDFKGLVENEALVLTIASALGLPVVEHEVIRLGKTNLLLIKRYDREVCDGEVLRLHQRDLCQATGLPPDIKYESEGGPSLKTAFNVVRSEVSDPLASASALLDWVAFNVLVHNADAHAKNLSVLRTSEGLQVLAPFYDLVCTGAYAPDHRMAMAVGGQFDPGAIARKHWIKFAADVDVGKSLVVRTVERLASRIPDVLNENLASLQAQLGASPRREQVARTIIRRAKKTADLIK